MLALALLAPLVAGRRYTAPFWSLVAVGALVLSLGDRTPLHAVAYLLPAFERLHPHNPGRILALAYLAVALLAGATWSGLPHRGKRVALLGALPLVGAVVLRARGVPLDSPVLLVVLLTGLLVAVHVGLPQRRREMSALMLSLVVLDLLVADASMIRHRLSDPGAQGFWKVHLEAYYEPTGAARFLREQTRQSPVRYFGYDPQISRWNILYRARFADPGAVPLLVNNRATMLGLHDIQGYNPIHLVRYDELIVAINGHTQEYRESYIYPAGLGSPLLDLLNTRYVVVPAATVDPWPEVQALEERYPAVYSDEQVRVLENPTALPRAWIVHSTYQVSPGEALGALTSGRVDPAITAVLEAPPPPVERPSTTEGEEVLITRYEADRIELRTRSAAPGMLVLSEMYYPAWKAYVDGQPVPLLRANHLLMGVALPEGEHTVELRAESRSLRIGLVITAAFALIVLALLVAAGRRHMDSH